MLIAARGGSKRFDYMNHIQVTNVPWNFVFGQRS